MKTIVSVGILIALVGCITIVISQTVKFTTMKTHQADSPFDMSFNYQVLDDAKKTTFLYVGCGLVFVGGVAIAKGLAEKK